MAVIYKEKITREQVFQCDCCKGVSPMSLVEAFHEAFSNKKWLFMDGDRVLCPDCVKKIIESWYNQREGDFQLESSVMGLGVIQEEVTDYGGSFHG